jgi:hypothetical protein
METVVEFPERVGPEQRAAILESIEKCAVETLIRAQR